MLLEENTLKTFGYNVSELSNGSKKPICLKCDYCQKEYTAPHRARIKSNAVLDKDACNDCKYQKRDECCTLKYGTTHPASTQEVKDKIKQTCIDKYGTDSYTQTEEFVDKSNKTKLEKFGTVTPMECPEVIAKQRATMMKNYGVEHGSHCPEIRQKTEDTNRERYGSASSFGSPEIREKCKETFIDKYGCENPFQSEEIKRKIVETNNRNLGVDYPMQNPDVQEKSRETVQGRYGVDNIAKLESIQSQIKETNLGRYGFEHATQNEEVRARAIVTNLETYGCEYPMQNEEIKAKARETAIRNGTIELFDGKTKIELARELDRAYSTFVVQVREHGFETACQIKTRENGLESLVRQTLDKHSVEYKQHAVIDGRKTDFLIEDNKLILEVDGLYWHSDRVLDDDNYHAKKQEQYTNAGYRSLFFREDEVKGKPEIIESIILNALGKSNKIFARKCVVGFVDHEVSNIFFQTNHLMGKGAGITFGLFYEGRLVTAMRVKRKEGDNFEVSRFCHAIGLSVTGAFSKILSFAERNLKMDSLLTFIDKRYGEGTYLPEFGFEYVSSHLSFKWVDCDVTYHRLKFPGNSGYEAGLNKIWDCGQTKYIKKYNKL